MYASFFGLEKDPFCTTPDPSILYLTTQHREALAGISYAVLKHKGFAMLSGDAGTGKTTLLSRLVKMAPRNQVVFSVILNSALNRSEFLESVMMDFGLEDIPDSKAQRLQNLQKFLMSEYSAGRTCVLLIDEAQKLSDEVLEEVRLLSNCELPDQKLLQIVLCGQSELDQLLEKHTLRQLKQRIAVRLRIEPLSPDDVDEYIQFRWRKAGATGAIPFEPAAVAAIAEYSKGIPRLINTLCDNSLLLAFGDAVHTVSVANVNEAARNLALTRVNDSALAQRNAPAVSTVEAPVPARLEPQPAKNIPEALPTLRRYGAAVPQKSRISRLAAKLPWARQADGVI